MIISKELTQKVTDLINLSISLDEAKKKETLALIPRMNEEQLNALVQLFEEEQKRKDELLQKALEKNPGLIEKLDKFAHENISAMYQEIEEKEKPLAEKELDRLIKELAKT
ncbi:MAG TPA: hypothetical protein ENI70_00140 [Candidatus Peregrinibacteria bacterium]|nr:hypothetical protein [Candidatus Peregrinibacteria bacterium]